MISLKSQFLRSCKDCLWIISYKLQYKFVWLDTWHDKTYTDIIIISNIVIHICESVFCFSGENLCRFFKFQYCIFVGHSMIKTGRVIITLTSICHIYLPAPATFIYQHLPHLSTSTYHIYLPAPATFIYQHLPHLSTSTCHIYLPAPAIFIYQHLPHLSTSTCHIYLPPPAFLTSNVVVFFSSVIWRKLFFYFFFIFDIS